MILQSARDLPKKFKRWYSNAVNADDYVGPEDEVRCPEEDTPFPPNLISSATGREEWHYLILDLDISHYYIESSTNGHAHLVFDHKWLHENQIKKIYEVLADVGILQRGFVDMFDRREAAFIRLDKDKLIPGDGVESSLDFFMVPPDQC